MSARSVSVSPALCKRWATSDGFELGLLLGQADAVLAAVAVPPETEDEAPRGFADVSVEWTAEFAAQLDRMLPGGVRVLGLYVRAALAPAAVFDKAPFYLREVAQALQWTDELAPPTVHFVVHIGKGTSSTKGYINIADAAKTETVTAKLDEKETPKLRTYRAVIGLNERVLFSSEPVEDPAELGEQRAQELKQQLQRFGDRLRGAVCVAKSEASDGAQFMDLLAPATAAVKNSENALVGRIRGTLAGVAYVCESEPEPEKMAALYLKNDLIRSLLLRIELAQEKWGVDADHSDGNAFASGRVCLPKRGAISWTDDSSTTPGPFDLTAYSFPDDDEAEVVQNALEIVGVQAVDGAIEQLEGGWAAVENERSFRDNKVRAEVKNSSAPSFRYLWLVLPVALAIVALLVQQSLAAHEDDQE